MNTYECNICNEFQEATKRWEPQLAICTDCWFDFLNGSERKAIAQRVKA